MPQLLHNTHTTSNNTPANNMQNNFAYTKKSKPIDNTKQELFNINQLEQQPRTH
jgi:hypothetical protein